MQKTKKLIIFGNSDFAVLMKYYIENYTNYHISNFCVDREYLQQDYIDNIAVLPFDELFLHEHPHDEYEFFIAIGYNHLNSIREKKYLQLKSMGYSFANFIHPEAYVDKTAYIGDNCLILENSVVQPFSKIGSNTFIWASSTICHNSVVGENCFIASNCCVNGFVTIGNNCFIGANAVIRDKLTISNNSLIGSGCTILENITQSTGWKAQPNIEIINTAKI